MLTWTWQGVVIVVVLIASGVVCAYLGQETMGGALIGGALGLVAPSPMKIGTGRTVPPPVPRPPQ